MTSEPAALASPAESTFADVRDAIFSDPYPGGWCGDGTPLPVARVTLASVLRGLGSALLPPPFRHGRYEFLEAAKRTLDSRADLIPGPDGRGFRRLLHPNGVCLIGRWEITEETPYTGFFARGSQGLLIARYSTCCTEVRRGYDRSLSLVGKLYPSLDPDERAVPAGFITQQDLGGERTESINDAVLRNAPDTRSWRRGTGVPVLLTTGAVFAVADQQPSMRQLYEVAELGKPSTRATAAPAFMQLVVQHGQPRVPGGRLDFRDEVLATLYDRGDATPRRTLGFKIQVTDEGDTQGPGFYQRRTFKNWREIGAIAFREAVASYSGDHVVHFHHPTWRADRNDPSSAVRRQGVSVDQTRSPDGDAGRRRT